MSFSMSFIFDRFCKLDSQFLFQRYNLQEPKELGSVYMLGSSLLIRLRNNECREKDFVDQEAYEKALKDCVEKITLRSEKTDDLAKEKLISIFLDIFEERPGRI